VALPLFKGEIRSIPRQILGQRAEKRSFCCEFVKKKSDAQVRRVNTFHILQTIRKKTLNLQILYGRTLKISKFLNPENVVLLLDPELPSKIATRFILR
jgi:hypothetical protein